jgi:hypothetical protein
MLDEPPSSWNPGTKKAGFLAVRPPESAGWCLQADRDDLAGIIPSNQQPPFSADTLDAAA